MSEKKNLVYTVAIDPKGTGAHRILAKMLVSSLLRTHFTGDIFVFTNAENPLFQVPREGVTEIIIDTPEGLHGVETAYQSWCWKYNVSEYINAEDYDTIMFLDVDSLALRNIDHLLEGDWDIAYQPERGLRLNMPQFNCFISNEEADSIKSPGVNSGTIAVKSEHYHAVMAEWKRIDEGPTVRPRNCSDQGSWNRLLIDTDLKTEAFKTGEVMFPMHLHQHFAKYSKAAVLHNLGGDIVTKIQFTFGVYMQAFYCDPSCLMIDILET